MNTGKIFTVQYTLYGYSSHLTGRGLHLVVSDVYILNKDNKIFNYAYMQIKKTVNKKHK